MSFAVSPTSIRSTESDLDSALGLDLLAMGAAAGGNLLLAARANAAPVALGLVAVACILRIAQHRTALVKIPLTLPWLLFIASAVVGVYVSFDFAHSLQKLFLILGGIGLYYVIATTQTNISKRIVVWGLLLICAATTVYFLTQTNFQAEPIKFGILQRLGLTIHALSPQLGFSTPHANLIAGILLLGFPYSIGLSFEAFRNKRWLVLLVTLGFFLFLGFGILMTTSRGAWLALALLGGLGIVLYGAAQLAKRAGYSAGIGIAVAVNVILIAILITILVGGPRVSNLVSTIAGSAGGVSRPQLYQEVAQLNQDYLFTGAGLDNFSPTFSTYLLLINVPFLPHAHNLYLEVWFEQGILGFVAFLWLIVAYYIWVARRWQFMTWLALASAAAFTLMLLHGFVDVIFYFSRVISLMFIPLGLTVAALQPFTPRPATSSQPNRRLKLIAAAAAAAVVVLLLLYGVTQRNRLTAQWYANRGSLAQAQAELPDINFPHPTASELRRQVDLTQAIALFNHALAIDPTNRVANTRLGLIALDQANFPQALRYLQAAYATDKNDYPVLKALGYTYVWTGQFAQAKPLLSQIPEAATELGYSAADWTQRGRPELSRNASTAVQQLK